MYSTTQQGTVQAWIESMQRENVENRKTIVQLQMKLRETTDALQQLRVALCASQREACQCNSRDT